MSATTRTHSGRHRATAKTSTAPTLPLLRPVIGRPPLGTYIAQLWQRRFFIRAESRAKAFSQSRNMLLGHIWLVVSPLLDAAVYGLLFGVLLHTSRGIHYFVLYLVIGITYFNMISNGLNGGCGLIQNRKNIIKAFSFPRASLVFSFSFRQVWDALPLIAVTFILVAFWPDGPHPHWTWLLFPGIYLLQVIFTTGLTFITAWLTDIIPDLKIVIRYATRFWFYASGVFFAIDHFVTHPVLLKVMTSNPAYMVLDMYRNTLLYATRPPLHEWLALTEWALGTFVIGFVVFWTREVKYARG